MNEISSKRCRCVKCSHSTCPPVESQAPYDEISQEVDNNVISIKVPKDAGRIQSLQDDTDAVQSVPFDIICADDYGKKCKSECVKVNVIPNKQPPPKEPEEETFLLRATKQIVNVDDLKNSLEIEFKAPRNYTPLPDPGPPPPVIQIVPKKKAEKGGKKRKK